MVEAVAKTCGRENVVVYLQRRNTDITTNHQTVDFEVWTVINDRSFAEATVAFAAFVRRLKRTDWRIFLVRIIAATARCGLVFGGTRIACSEDTSHRAKHCLREQ